MTQDQPVQLPRFDASVASIARIYDYWLGGKDNFQVDREAAEAMIQQYPNIVAGVRMNRAFLGRAVHHLAAEESIRQFLDIGTGLPSSNNTRSGAARRAWVADRLRGQRPHRAVSCPGLLTSSPEGACAYIDADIRDTGTILRDAAEMLDFSRPVAVCLIMILQFVPDQDDPWQITRALMDAMPSGSYPAVAHPASDVDQEVAPALRRLNTRMGGIRAVPRSYRDVTRFFEGLEMTEPGLVQLHRWRPGDGLQDNGRDLAAYGGVGRKP